VETTDCRLDEIAAMVGFGSAEILRRNFEKINGVTAGDYRITFKTTPQSIAS
jgi:AraC family transcriptional activator FtrA